MPRVKLDRQQILRLLDGYPVQVATEVGLLEFEATQEEWRPLRRIEVPPHMRDLSMTRGTSINELWTNDTYEVMVSYLDGKSPDSGWHLSIKRYDRAAVRNWRHFQQMKNEICGDMCEGLELFPSEGRLADNANQYHLWVMPLGEPIPIGFEGGMTIMDPDDVDQLNRNGGKGRQEPRQPGLTVGDGMEQAQREQGLLDHPARRAIIEGRLE